MSRQVRRETALRLQRGEIHSGHLDPSVAGVTDKEDGVDITINRDHGIFRTSVFRDRELLAKTLIHEGQHIRDFAILRPRFMSVIEYYHAQGEELERRAERAERKEYVP